MKLDQCISSNKHGNRLKKVSIEKLNQFRKINKISMTYLSQEMGYTTVHIGRVLSGKSILTDKFERLLVLALLRYSFRSYKDLKDKLKDTIWESLFLTL